MSIPSPAATERRKEILKGDEEIVPGRAEEEDHRGDTERQRGSTRSRARRRPARRRRRGGEGAGPGRHRTSPGPTVTKSSLKMSTGRREVLVVRAEERLHVPLAPVHDEVPLVVVEGRPEPFAVEQDEGDDHEERETASTSRSPAATLRIAAPDRRARLTEMSVIRPDEPVTLPRRLGASSRPPAREGGRVAGSHRG